MYKSKVIVFRKGGKLGISEKWYYRNELMEVVNQYKYLRVIFTSTLPQKVHFEDKLERLQCMGKIEHGKV